MTLEQTIIEWKSKSRRMGCVATANWFCKRQPSFKPLRKTYYTPKGEVYEHVVAFDGVIEIDLAPYNNTWSE